MTIPKNLNHDLFLKTFDEWIEYRKTVLKKPLNPFTIDRQLKKLSAWGPERAIESINNSMDNQYQGLFEPKQKFKPGFPISDKAYDQQKRKEKVQQVENVGPFATPKELADVLRRATGRSVDEQIGS